MAYIYTQASCFHFFRNWKLKKKSFLDLSIYSTNRMRSFYRSQNQHGRTRNILFFKFCVFHPYSSGYIIFLAHKIFPSRNTIITQQQNIPCIKNLGSKKNSCLILYKNNLTVIWENFWIFFRMPPVYSQRIVACIYVRGWHMVVWWEKDGRVFRLAYNVMSGIRLVEMYNSIFQSTCFWHVMMIAVGLDGIQWVARNVMYAKIDRRT